MNIMQVQGNVGGVPVTRFTASGQKVTTFNVATNKKKGETVITTWYTITIWGDRFDKMLKFVTTGSSLVVIGELQEVTLYKDKQGQDRPRLEIWAELIRFSPSSGKSQEQRSDHSGEQRQQHGEQQQQQQRQHDPRFSEPRPSGDRQDSFSSAPAYEDEEDRVPF